MRSTLSVLLVCFGTLPATALLVAHHSHAAEYDSANPVKLEGVVTKMEWVNPHCWLHLNVETPDGTENWMVEGGPPSALFKRGFNKNSLAPGTEIRVVGYRARDGGQRANGREFTYAADGRRLFMGTSGSGAPQDGFDPSERR